MIQSGMASLDNGPAAKRAKTDSATNRSVEADKCFICDTLIIGKKYSLASCMTNGTKVRLVEVLGRLVSDNYMVVVSHSEHICRGCANLLNTLDRLEAEISSVKRIVLNFIERKYKLGDKLQTQLTPTPVVYSKTSVGLSASPTTPNKAIKPQPAVTNKLVSSPAATTKTTPVVPPTQKSAAQSPSTPKPAISKPKPSGPTQTSTPVRTKSYKITLKDDQLLGQSSGVLQTAEQKVLNQTPVNPRNVWMQCNQCQFTTNQRSTMLEHLRQHVAARNTGTKGSAASKGEEASTSTTPTTTTVTSPVTSPVVLTSGVNGTPGNQNSPNVVQIATPNAVSSGSPCIMVASQTPTSKLMLALDGKVPASMPGTKQALILRKGSAVTAPGIVSKVLAGNKIVTLPSSQTTDSGAKNVTSTVEVATKVVTPQTTKKASPEPSMPLLQGDDDM